MFRRITRKGKPLSLRFERDGGFLPPKVRYFFSNFIALSSGLAKLERLEERPYCGGNIFRTASSIAWAVRVHNLAAVRRCMRFVKVLSWASKHY